jgi:histidine triad (HIT) family protein
MTLFEKIIAREIPAQIVAETDELLAFRDIHPQAPVHVLCIPKRPIATLDDADDPALLGRLLAFCAEVARREGVAADGYRVVINTRADGGQTVYHLHAHVLGGRAMGWPPG